LDPLLRAMIVLNQIIEKESHQAEINDELGRDLSHLMLKIIETTEIEENKQESLQVMKACIYNLG
jgi:hypothetical protein